MKTRIYLFMVSLLCTISLTINAQHKPYKPETSNNVSTGRSTYTAPTQTHTEPTRSYTPSSNSGSINNTPRSYSNTNSNSSNSNSNSNHSNNNSNSNSNYNYSNNNSNSNSNSNYSNNNSNSNNYNYSNNNSNYNTYSNNNYILNDLLKDLMTKTPPPVYTESELLAKSDKVIQTKTAMRPTITGVEVAFQKFSVNVQDGAKLQMASGTEVTIPANALKYSNGKIAQGQVDVQYREFHNTADLLASGIPMYDAKTQIYMESAGMFELNASQNGQALALESGKTIQVAMVSENPSSTFDVWQYNPKTKNWNEIDGAGQPQAKVIVPSSNQQNEGLTSDSRSTVPNNTRPSNSTATATTTTNNYQAVRPTNISTLGIINHDKARSFVYLPNTASYYTPIKFDKKIHAARKLKKVKFYFVTQKGKSIIPIARRRVKNVQIADNTDFLVAVLPNKHIATFNYQDYATWLPTQTFGTPIVFKVSNQPIQSMDNLQAALPR